MKVKCINPIFSSGKLKLDQIYEAENFNTNYFIIKGIPLEWRKDRFIVMEETVMKVKCINNDSNSVEDCPLVKGNIYEVISETESDFKLKGEDRSWCKGRFIVADDTTTSIKSNPINLNEECPCGIGLLRSQCNYHNGS